MDTSILNSQTPFWLLLLVVALTLVPHIITVIIAFKVEKKKNRPQITIKKCKLSGDDVEISFNENNQVSEPCCTYSGEDFACKLHISRQELDAQDKIRIRRNKKDKCYIALWSRKQNGKES